MKTMTLKPTMKDENHSQSLNQENQSSDKLQQQRIHPMRMHNIIAGRPGEYGKPAILRGYQGKGITLIVYKLGRSKVPGTAILSGCHNLCGTINNRFGHHNFLYSLIPMRAGDLC